MTNYVAWGTTSQGGFGEMELLQNYRDRAELRSGVSLSDGFPSDAYFSPTPKSQVAQLADAVATREGNGVMVVSSGLRDFLVDLHCPALEFLPVQIHDHDGNVASDSYWIANSFHVVDALNEDEMGIVRNPLDKSIMAMQRLALRSDALDDEPVLFRARGFEQRVLVRRDIADTIAAQFSGVFFYELHEVRS